MPNIINDDTLVNGALSCSTFSVTSASIANTMIATPGSGGDYIGAAKIKPRVPIGFAQVDGTVSTGEARIFSAYAGGSLLQVNISLDTVNTSSDTVVVDLQKSTSGGAYATVLSSTYTMNSSKTARTVYTVAPNSTSFVAGDIFKVVWTVSGTSAADLLVVVFGDINPS